MLLDRIRNTFPFKKLNPKTKKKIHIISVWSYRILGLGFASYMIYLMAINGAF